MGQLEPGQIRKEAALRATSHAADNLRPFFFSLSLFLSVLCASAFRAVSPALR
jgi:hypothetical protein